jgi:hypothetical protein
MGLFLEHTADTPSFRILEYFLEARETDHAASDVIALTGVPRSTFYAVWPRFVRHGYVRQTRIVGKTPLYALERTNPYVHAYLTLFDTCLRESLRTPDRPPRKRARTLTKPQALQPPQPL